MSQYGSVKEDHNAHFGHRINLKNASIYLNLIYERLMADLFYE